MRVRNKIVSVFLLFALLPVGVVLAGGKEIKLTTNSEEAKKYFAEAIHALENFQFQQFGQLAGKAVEADPAFAMGHMAVAAMTPQNKRQEVVEKYMSLAEKASEGERRYLEGMKHVHHNNPDKGLEVFESLAKDYPGDRRVQMMLGQLSRNAGKLDQAMAAFEKANMLDSSTPRATSFMGDIYLLRDDFASARKHYKMALKKVDRDASPFGPFFGLAFAHLYEGNPDGALEVTKEYMDRYNRNGAAQGFPPSWIWNWRARVNLENGRLEEAMRCYETGYKTVPGSQIDSLQKIVWEGRKQHGIARVLAKMGKHEKAWKIAEKIKMQLEQGGEEAEQYWPAYYYLAGYLKLEAGDYKAAKEYLEQADQTDPFQKLLLARTALKLGEKDYALEICGEIVKYTNSNLERALAYPEAKKIIAKYSSN